MAINGNISNESGDVFIIRSEVVVTGLIALSDFIDTVTGSWSKEFRYTVDGINFTPWVPLTNANLDAVEVESTDTFIIEYRYTNQNNTEASFSNITVNGEFEETGCGDTYTRSIFNRFFSCSDTEVLNWCINVTNKLYKQGIVPNFIQRGRDSNINGEDRDYIDFWRTVACFFAYIVVLARKLKDFRQVDFLLDDFLRNRGIFFCDKNSNTEKNYLVENYFDEIRQRGTSRIYKTKEENGSVVDGELLRTICYEECDEFIFNLHLPHTIGWSVGNSSPLIKSCVNQIGTNKSYESTDDFLDLSKYPLFGNGNQSIVIDGNKSVLSIQNVPDGELSGIGNSNSDFLIPVDNGISYEVSFFARQPQLDMSLPDIEDINQPPSSSNFSANSGAWNINDDVNGVTIQKNAANSFSTGFFWESNQIFTGNSSVNDITLTINVSQFSEGGLGAQWMNSFTISLENIVTGDTTTAIPFSVTSTGQYTYTFSSSSLSTTPSSYRVRILSGLNIFAAFPSISFDRFDLVLQRASLSLNPTINFGLLSYDKNGMATTLQKISDSSTENNFFESVLLPNTNDYFFVRGILYSKDAVPADVENILFGDGVNLQMKDDTFKIIPYIASNNQLGSSTPNINELRVWNLKIRPLNTSYSTGFVNPKNFISIWLNHKNGEVSRQQLESRMRRQLLPYNSTFKVNYLNEDFQQTT